MSELLQINLVPAQPGWRVIYSFDEDDDPSLYVGSSVIAWRLITRTSVANDDGLYSEVKAICFDGDEAENAYGYLAPDGRIECWMGDHENLELATVAFLKYCKNKPRKEKA